MMTHGSGVAPSGATSVLTDELLNCFARRRAKYDSENTFFSEDFEELRQIGYLRLAVPTELGGLGFTLVDAVREQRRLAYHAPATALAINMHLYWTGVAADLLRAGDTSLKWLLEETVRGGVFAAGHAESGNDIPLLLSTTKAERVEGGYRFSGRKSFGSLTPVWTFLGMHGMDASEPSAPKIVHAFMPRNAEGYRIEETWDVLGMRATRSDDTILESAFVPDRCIARVVSPGPKVLFSAKYHAVESSWRAVDLALEVAGGFGILRRSGLEQLFRDARLGRIHPANSMLTHEIVAKTVLGISPDETPRWG